jgi:hypothetical protein
MMNYPLNAFPEIHPASRAGRRAYRRSAWGRPWHIIGRVLASVACAAIVWGMLVGIVLVMGGVP